MKKLHVSGSWFSFRDVVRHLSIIKSVELNWFEFLTDCCSKECGVVLNLNFSTVLLRKRMPKWTLKMSDGTYWSHFFITLMMQLVSHSSLKQKISVICSRALNAALSTSGKYCHSTFIVDERHQDFFRMNSGASVFASWFYSKCLLPALQLRKKSLGCNWVWLNIHPQTKTLKADVLSRVKDWQDSNHCDPSNSNFWVWNVV